MSASTDSRGGWMGRHQCLVHLGRFDQRKVSPVVVGFVVQLSLRRGALNSDSRTLLHITPSSKHSRSRSDEIVVRSCKTTCMHVLRTHVPACMHSGWTNGATQGPG